MKTRLIWIAPSGRIATISRAAGASTNASNSVPFGVWRQQWPGSGGYITQVSVTATVVYAQQAGSTSPSAATAIATLGSDTVTVSASARGDNHTASLPGKHLIRVAPSGRIATITRSASASTDTSNVRFGL